MNNITQYELLSESFWSKFKKGAGYAARVVNAVSPELYNAYRTPYNNIKNALTGDIYKLNDKKTFNYSGEKYIPTFKSKPQRVNNNYIVDVYQLDANDVPITSKTYKMVVDSKYRVLKVQ